MFWCLVTLLYCRPGVAVPWLDWKVYCYTVQPLIHFVTYLLCRNTRRWASCFCHSVAGNKMRRSSRRPWSRQLSPWRTASSRAKRSWAFIPWCCCAGQYPHQAGEHLQTVQGVNSKQEIKQQIIVVTRINFSWGYREQTSVWVFDTETFLTNNVKNSHYLLTLMWIVCCLSQGRCRILMLKIDHK